MSQTSSDIKKPVDQLSYEEALSELEMIVKKLEVGQGNLNDAISSYERGIELKNKCETILKEAQMKIEQITVQKTSSSKKVPQEETEKNIDSSKDFTTHPNSSKTVELNHLKETSEND